MVKFSILVPAYKSKFLFQCIQSILAQTYNNFEVIIVNDASPEDLDSIVYEFKDSRIKYYKNEINFGAINVVDNWNKCLDLSTGDFVICMGDDDMLMAECLEEFSILIHGNPYADVFHMRVRVIDEDDNVQYILPERPEHQSLYSYMLSRINGTQQYLGDFCYRASRLKNEGGFYKLPYAWGSDDITSYNCANPWGVINSNKPLFSYRISRYTISNSGHEQDKLVAIQLIRKWLFEFVDKQKTYSEVEREELSQLMTQIPKYYSNCQVWILVPLLKRDFVAFISVASRFKVTINTLFKTFFCLLVSLRKSRLKML